jgi:hypothetical protein
MRKFLLLFPLLLLTLGLFGQRTVTGKVTDSSGQPLIGANVFVKGSTVGTVTDFDGMYSITIPEGYDMLIISYTGYATQELSPGQSSELNVSMSKVSSSRKRLFTALGVTREKKSLGYSVQEVKGEDLNIVKTDNFINQLSGRTSGVQVRRTTNMGGSTNVNIRGIHSLTG